MEILIDHLTSSDIPPLIDTLSEISLSDINAVDLYQKSSNVLLDGESLLLLLSAVNQKLRVVDLINSSFWKDALRYVILNFTRSPLVLEFLLKFQINNEGVNIQVQHQLSSEIMAIITEMSINEAKKSCVLSNYNTLLSIIISLM